VVASGPAAATLTTDAVTRAFEHPIEVARHGLRWSARAVRRTPAA
jgi:iron complex transport system ATP-binding protein